MTDILVQDWQEQKNIQLLAARRFRLTQLFGDEKGEEGEQVKELAKYLDDLSEAAAQLYRQQVRASFNGEELSLPHHAGCIQFFPSFFDSIGLDVINPHDRKTGAGKLPIYFECVPAKTTGTFSLLYVPINVPAKGSDVADDLKLLAEGIVAMLTLYGFGAKTSSGYGRAEDALSTPGEIIIHTHLPALLDAAEHMSSLDRPIPPKPVLPGYVEMDEAGHIWLQTDLRNEDASLKSEAEYQRTIEQQGKKYKKSDKQRYTKAKNWWEYEGHAIWQQQLAEPEPAHQPEPEPEPEPERPVTTTCSFQSLGELLEKADTIAAALKEGGDE
jgi:CRISPR-associated protein Cmr2